MTVEVSEDKNLCFFPLTSERWSDFEALFGVRGACGGCWCTYWFLPRSQFEAGKGPGNRQAIKEIVDAERCPGLLAYLGEQAVGWCALAPREAYPVLERSRVLKRVDDLPVWSVVCFFVARQFRRKGVTVGLLKAAVEYAASHGARILEGYPVEPKKGGDVPAPFAYTGLASAFRRAGFVEVLRRSETRPIMRYYIQQEKI